MILCDIGAYKLAEAIVQRAAIDYRDCLRHGDRKNYSVRELENFFNGPMFGSICGNIEPTIFMQMIADDKMRKRKTYHRSKPYPPRKKKGANA